MPFQPAWLFFIVLTAAFGLITWAMRPAFTLWHQYKQISTKPQPVLGQPAREEETTAGLFGGPQHPGAPDFPYENPLAPRRPENAYTTVPNFNANLLFLRKREEDD